MKNKPKSLKASLKLWWASEKLNRSILKSGLLSRLNVIDKLVDGGEVSDVILKEICSIKAKLSELECREFRNVSQKAIVKWSIDGDENSKYFQAILNKKHRNISIQEVKVEVEWITEVDRVKNAFVDHFKDKFKKFEVILVVNKSSRYKMLTIDQANYLDIAVEEEEVKMKVWVCGNEKAPGPDSFNFSFVNQYCKVVKSDIIAFVADFFEKSSIPTGCNSSFITLIPKVSSPVVVNDFIPISVIGILYSILSKILTLRLFKLVQSCQFSG